jgi:sortase A
MPYARFTYRTELRRIVDPGAYAYVTARKRYDRLALTACHPLYSAAKRIVVFARLVDVQARGRARVQASL